MLWLAYWLLVLLLLFLWRTCRSTSVWPSWSIWNQKSSDILRNKIYSCFSRSGYIMYFILYNSHNSIRAEHWSRNIQTCASIVLSLSFWKFENDEVRLSFLLHSLILCCFWHTCNYLISRRRVLLGSAVQSGYRSCRIWNPSIVKAFSNQWNNSHNKISKISHNPDTHEAKRRHHPFPNIHAHTQSQLCTVMLNFHLWHTIYFIF